MRSSAQGEELREPIKERRKTVFAQSSRCFFIFLGQSKLQHPAISKISFNSTLICLAYTRTGKDLGRQTGISEHLRYLLIAEGIV